MATRSVKKPAKGQTEPETLQTEPEIVFEPASALVEEIDQPETTVPQMEIVFEPANFLVEEMTEAEIVFEPAPKLIEEVAEPAPQVSLAKPATPVQETSQLEETPVAKPRRPKGAIKSVGEAVIPPATPLRQPEPELEAEVIAAAEPGLNSRNFLVPYILLMLRDSVLHGYAIWEQLTLLGIPGLSETDRVNIYRTLRQLEREGKISSQWETDQTGPAKRVYSLTSGGENFLRLGALGLRQYRQSLDFFFKLYTGGRVPSPFEASLTPVRTGTNI